MRSQSNSRARELSRSASTSRRTLSIMRVPLAAGSAAGFSIGFGSAGRASRRRGRWQGQWVGHAARRTGDGRAAPRQELPRLPVQLGLGPLGRPTILRAEQGLGVRRRIAPLRPGGRYWVATAGWKSVQTGRTPASASRVRKARERAEDAERTVRQGPASGGINGTCRDPGAAGIASDPLMPWAGGGHDGRHRLRFPAPGPRKRTTWRRRTGRFRLRSTKVANEMRQRTDRGEVATYIPELAKVDLRRFGIAVVGAGARSRSPGMPTSPSRSRRASRRSSP